MEKFMQRENVHIGYGKSPRSSDSGDMDFNDVFGGPPRRFSMQEVRARYSFGEPEEETPSSPWKEKPVFGEERRRKGADFFDDIFKGVDHDLDRDHVFGSNPSSRIMSPIADPLSTSLPAPAFSLPAKLSKGMDLPTFGSHNHGGSNGCSSPQSWGALSRFSNEAARSMDESSRNEVDQEIPLFKESEKNTYNFDSIGKQFHFSIYKWAGQGLMPLVIENNLKSKDKLKSASSNGRMERKSSPIRKGGFVTSKEEQNHIQLPESKPKISPSLVKEEANSVDERNVGEKIEKQVPVTVKIREGLNSQLKPLHAFLAEGDQPEESIDGHDSNQVKENGRKGVTQGKGAASKGKVKDFVQIFNQETDAQGTFNSRRGNVGIDNKGINEVSSNPEKIKQEVKQNNVDKKTDVPIEVVENLKKKGINEANSNPEKVKLEVKENNADMKPDVPFKVVENLKNTGAQQGYYTPRRTTARSSSTLRRSFSAGSQPRKDLLSPEIDDPLEDNFVVQELSNINENATENDNSEDTKAIDAKIRQWSAGKKGNIRSLLSTLQYVLWAESGWKAVPLVDLIEANAVKRAYQKALLRLHPDKLQQKGASFHHKYTAEKVFDILQEAWDHFNTCSSLGI